MLSCLGAVTKKYKKGEDIYRVGESIQLFGMVIEGGVNIESDDLWGNKSILSHIEPGFICKYSWRGTACKCSSNGKYRNFVFKCLQSS